MNNVITKIAKKKIIQARKGEISLPVIKGIALGTGDAERIPLQEDTQLQEEIIRKDYSVFERISETHYRYRIELSADEMAGKIITEAALYDSDGDLLAIQTFNGIPKENGMEMAFEYDDMEV